MGDPVKRRLLARGVLATDEWLNTCANTFRSSNEYVPGQDRLEEYIFKHWLTINLCELRVSSFPPDLENQLKVTLNGQYTCQIVSVIDTGHSAYSQYQKVRNVDNTNLTVDDKDTFQKKWEPKSSRTLLMSITDGVEELVALEARRIPALSINLKPGCKAIIKGPITCRRGFIMLEKAEQITILGGEVEGFLIPNAYENILALSLGLPINDNPRIATGTNSDELLNEEGNEQQERRNIIPRAETNRRPNAPAPAKRPSGTGTAPVQPVVWIRPEARPHEVNDFLDDDDLLSIDLDNIVATQQEIAPNTGTGSSRSNPMSECTARSTYALDQSRPTFAGARKPDSLRLELNRPPSKQPSPVYTMDIDEDLLSEFSNDLNEADFSQKAPTPPRRVFSNSKRPNSIQQDNSVPPSKILNLGKPKSVSATAKQSRAISDWFKPDGTNVSGNPSISRSDVSRSEKPSRIAINSERSGSGEQTDVAPKSQDSGFPADDNDIVLLAEEELFLQNVLTVETDYERQRKEGPLKVADIVKNILEGEYAQAANVKTKVKIRRVVESLNVKNDEWKMAVEITDGSADMLVSVSSEVVTKIFGITPAEGAKKRKEAVTNFAVKEELKMAFRRLETTLKTLDCIFELLINPGQKPCVVNIHV